MNNLSDFLSSGDLVIKELYKKIEASKEHLNEEQKESLNKEISKAEKDIAKAVNLLKEFKGKI